nr:unnamed protein product [Callosobruchus analis]
MASKYVIKLHDIMMFFKDEEKLISKGENAVESGHVTSLISDADLHLIRGKVHASMKDREYNVEVEFNSEWVIKSATCNCPRGQLRCHHMAALILFARDNISVTDKKCMWSKPKQLRDPDVKKLSDLYPPKDHRSTARDLTDEEIEQFKHKLSVFDGSVGFSWLLSEESNQEGNSESPSIVDIESLIFHEDYVTSTNKLRYFEDHLKVDDEYVKQIAQQTIGQQSNPRWLLARKNRLTASNFSAVIAACKRQRFPPSLFKRLLGTYNMEHLKAIQWGNMHEKEGIKSLEDSLNVKVVPTGIWLHECGYLGASPDGLIGENEIVEVKCPYKYRDVSLLDDIKSSRNYIIFSDEEGNITVNRDHEYFLQIQGQLAITKRKNAHLVIWTPKEVAIVNIEAECFNEHLNVLKMFYFEHYIPFLLGEKHM